MRLLPCLLLCLTLAFTGCAIRPGADTRGSRLLPWNWLSSDSSSQASQAQSRSDAAADRLRVQAQRMAEATRLAIDSEKSRQLTAGAVSRQLETAADYAGRTTSLLGASEGPLDLDAQRELPELVQFRNSQIEAERARGDKLMAAADRTAENAATRKIEAEKDLAVAHQKIGNEQQRALLAEEKYRRIWFWLWCALGGIALLKLLPLLAGAFPALSPLARAASWVLAPTIQAGYSRLCTAVGHLIAHSERAGTVSADAIRSHLDGPITAHEQQEIRRHYEAAKSS